VGGKTKQKERGCFLTKGRKRTAGKKREEHYLSDRETNGLESYKKKKKRKGRKKEKPKNKTAEKKR